MGSWSSGGNLNTARRYLAGAGTQTAGLSFGGYDESVNTNVTEEYNGTSWSAGGSLNTARLGLAGAGTQTAGLSFGGGYGSANTNVTEEYNGTSWSAGGSLNTARLGLAGAGTQTAGLSFGGGYGSANTNVTEEYNGTSWSAGGSLNTARLGLAGAGTQTAGLSFGGGYGSANTNVTEEYNGTSWSAGGSLNTARLGLAGAGTQTAGLSFGGGYGSANTNVTEEYNGTSWSAGGSLNTARLGLAGAGTQTAGLSFGGYDGSANTNVTEEYAADVTDSATASLAYKVRSTHSTTAYLSYKVADTNAVSYALSYDVAELGWLTGWSYRKEITVNNTGSALSDYQLCFTVNRSSGSDSGFTVYVSTNCESDYDDIRFTTSDGTTLCDYWIESSSASTATIWVEVPSIAGSGDTTLYLYYGNSSATAGSSIANTFPYGDAFASFNSGLYDTSGAGSASVSDGVATLTGDKLLATKTKIGNNHAFRARIKTSLWNSTSGYQFMEFSYYSGLTDKTYTSRQMFAYPSSGGERALIQTANNFANYSAQQLDSGDWAADTWGIVEIRRAGDHTEVWINDTQQASLTHQIMITLMISQRSGMFHRDHYHRLGFHSEARRGRADGIRMGVR